MNLTTRGDRVTDNRIEVLRISRTQTFKPLTDSRPSVLSVQLGVPLPFVIGVLDPKLILRAGTLTGRLLKAPASLNLLSSPHNLRRAV